MHTYLYKIFSTLNINSNIHHLEAEQLSIPYSIPSPLNGALLPAIYRLDSYLYLTVAPIPWITGPYLQYV